MLTRAGGMQQVFCCLEDCLLQSGGGERYRVLAGVTYLACLLGRPLTWGNPCIRLISTKGKLVIIPDIIYFF